MNHKLDSEQLRSKNSKGCPDLIKFLDLVKKVKYGSVTLVIQDGQWIQIDVNEKMRLV